VTVKTDKPTVVLKPHKKV